MSTDLTTTASTRLQPVTEHDQPAPSDLLEAVERAGELLQRIPGKLARLHIENGAARIEMEWQPAPVPGAGLAPAPAPAAASGIPQSPAAPEEPGGESDITHAGECVRSPLVGTFYRCPEPGAAPFVAEGDAVSAGDVVGIVEAMKLMNNITAPVSGRVVHIGVEDAHSVEYDQLLLVIVPDGIAPDSTGE
ncbi:MAG: biotin/lipoyl-containing protein [Tetrasphaera sp.]